MVAPNKRSGMRHAAPTRVVKKSLRNASPAAPTTAADDEDIDDDVAFNSDDEKRYGSFFSARPSTKTKEVLEEAFDADDDDGGFSDDSRDEIDIGELLDSKDERKRAAEERRRARGIVGPSSSADKKVPSSKKGKRARLLQPERLLEAVDSTPTATKTPGHKIANLASLLGAVSGATDEKLRPRLESLQAAQGLIGTEALPEERERLEREEVRLQVKRDMKKWRAFIKQQVNARTINFPLHVSDANPVPTTLSGIAHIHQEAQVRKAEAGAVGTGTALRSKMSALLRESGLGGKSASKNIGVGNHNNAEEEDGEEKGGDFVPLNSTGEPSTLKAPDMHYVAKLKALVGYDIAKRKRFNKIKSKTYRRILRKEKERQTEIRQRAFELLDPDAARKRAQRKLDKMRAEERVTQKHKNTSKWVRHVKHTAKFDEGAREAIQEQDTLRRRLMAKAEESADEEFDAAAKDESSSEDEERRVDELLKGNPHVTSTLWANSNADSDHEGLNVATGDERDVRLAKARKDLESMEFMQKARQRHEAQAKVETALLMEDVSRHRRGLPPLHAEEMLAVDSADDDEDRAEARRILAPEDERSGDANTTLQGRIAAKRAAAAAARAEEKRAETERIAELRSTAAGSGRKKFGMSRITQQQEQGGDVPRQQQQFSVDIPLPSTKGLVVGQGAAMTPQQRRSSTSGRQTGEVLNDVTAPSPNPLTLVDVDDGVNEAGGVEGGEGGAVPPADASTALARSATKKRPAAVSGASPKRSRVESHGVAVAEAAAVTAPPTPAEDMASQEYLVARAFARDDIDEDFAAAKQSQVDAAIAPEDPNASLPGWGEWGGMSERLNLKHKARVAENELKRNIERSSLAAARADAKLSHAIINHDVGMVADKYTLHVVPRPFDTAIQYQRAVRQPLGPEFNSVRAFQDGVAPRVVTRRGVVIDPVDEGVGVSKKAATTRRKEGSTKSAPRRKAPK